MSRLTDNLQAVRRRLDAACAAAKRPASAVRLLAVSKTFPAADAGELFAAGQPCFGENKVQELEAKAPVLPAAIEWHLIGHLQHNKVRAALQYAAWIHSVDSADLLARIERIAAETGAHPKLLLEVNVSGEESKFGLRPEEVLPVLRTLPPDAPAPVVGLMTMAPFNAPPETLHQVFAGLRTLRDQCAAATGLPLPELSMGMSGDFEIAVAEGSTIVRVGTAIFGHRDYSQQ
jgi:pyridoxal phosphate enzyme (YggS family)